jgi:imidazolonepropionase
MLIHSASQLLTIKGAPQRGLDLGQLNIIEDGAVLIRDDRIEVVGESANLLTSFPDEPRLNAAGKVVMPGFVDPHTHLPWAGDRVNEFEMRMMGKSYQEIMAAGGGITSTVQATRQCDKQQLLMVTRERANTIFKHGTTTAEAKTGYGLDLESELRLLEILTTISQEGPLDIIPTFLAAHTIPPEYQKAPDEYVKLICEDMLPAVQSWWRQHQPGLSLPFIDVFCDRGAFNLRQTEVIFKTSHALGFHVKIHSDEFENLGGTRLAVQYNAVSADHLVKTTDDDIAMLAASPTISVSLPCTPFGLGENDFTPLKKLIDSNALIALASDFNPGTAWCGNMQFCIALACRTMQITPAQAVVAATINAAAAIELDDRIGSIEPGKQADLIILTVDDYRHLAYRFGINMVHCIIKAGRIFSSNEVN